MRMMRKKRGKCGDGSGGDDEEAAANEGAMAMEGMARGRTTMRQR